MIHNTQALIVDVATSAFVPEKGVILEIATILVDLTSLSVVDVFSGVCRWTAAEMDGAPDFHGPLVEECLAAEITLRGREGFLLAGPWTGAGLVVNRALDFDLKWLAKHAPLFHKELSRPGKLHLDLKALETLAVARGATPFTSSTPRTYRSGDDAIAAYEELVYLLGALQK